MKIIEINTHGISGYDTRLIKMGFDIDIVMQYITTNPERYLQGSSL